MYYKREAAAVGRAPRSWVLLEQRWQPLQSNLQPSPRLPAAKPAPQVSMATQPQAVTKPPLASDPSPPTSPRSLQRLLWAPSSPRSMRYPSQRQAPGPHPTLSALHATAHPSSFRPDVSQCPVDHMVDRPRHSSLAAAAEAALPMPFSSASHAPLRPPTAATPLPAGSVCVHAAAATPAVWPCTRLWSHTRCRLTGMYALLLACYHIENPRVIHMNKDMAYETY